MSQYTRSTTSERTKGYLAILTSTFLYGWFGVLVKLIGDGIPIFYQSLTRNILIVTVLLAVVIGSRTNLRRVRRGDLVRIVTRSSFGFVNICTALLAFNHLSIGLAYILFFSGLLLASIVIGVLLNRERLTRVSLISLGLTFVGVIFAYSYRTEVSGDVLYMILALLSGGCVAFWSIIAKHISADISATILNLYDAALLAVFSGIFSVVVGERWVTPTVSTAWIANLCMAITFIFAGILVPYGFRRVSTHIGSILTTLEIVFGVIFGWLFFNEMLHITMILGCVLIIIASTLPHVAERADNMHTHRL